jgi:hypothetical protein
MRPSRQWSPNAVATDRDAHDVGAMRRRIDPVSVRIDAVAGELPVNDDCSANARSCAD